MSIARWQLPNSWVWSLAGDIAVIIGGGTPASKNPENFANDGIPWLTPADLTDYQGVYIRHGMRDLSESGYRNSSAQLVPRGTVLFSSRAPIGYCVIAENEISTNQGFKNFVLPDGILPEYFRYYLISAKDFAETIASGTTFKELSGSRAATIPIPIAPTAEQRRIVTKLDTLFARTRRAREELARIPMLIEHYKQGIFTAAFSGDLSADWRNTQQKYDAIPWPIPDGWTWGKIEDIAEIMSNLVAPEAVPDLPHIAPNHIESGIPRLLPYSTVKEDGVISSKHRFFPGQILYSKIRPYLRKAVLVDFEGVCSADMYPMNPKGNAEYLLYWLISPGFNDLAMQHQGRTVLPKINQKALYSIATPIPPIDEQKEISRRIQIAFSRIDKIASQTQKSLLFIDQLEQSILTKAFRGELVPQDPNDEPASVLLERIRVSGNEKPVQTRLPMTVNHEREIE